MDPFNRRQTQEAMARLDPILQILLNLVNQYQECMDKMSSSTTASPSRSVNNEFSETTFNNDHDREPQQKQQLGGEEDEEQILGIIRAQVQLLQQIQQVIEDLDSNDTNSRSDSPTLAPRTTTTSFSRSLSILSEYISLPLNAILQITSNESALGSESSSSTPDEETERGHKIRASSVRQLQEETSRTITVYVDKCSSVSTIPCWDDVFQREVKGKPSQLQSKQDTKNTPSPFPARRTYLPNAHVVRFLISLATVLPMGTLPAPSTKNSSHATSTSMSPRGVDPTSSSLDSGIDCQIAILKAITTLFSCAGPSNTNTNKGLANDIAKALNGVLLARIADACSFLLLQVTAPAVLPVSSSSSRRLQPQSAHLALHTLHTLDAMFCAIPDETILWQALFPGIFAALYRFWMRLRRLGTASGLGSEMQYGGLKTLTHFLRLTLTTVNVKEEKGPKETPAFVMAELQLLAKKTKESSILGAMAQEEAPLSAVESSGIDKGNKTGEAKFVEEVNSRLVGPLTALVQTIAQTSTSSVKVEAVSFCRAILVDTRGCWISNDKKGLFNVALEYCLMLQQDNDERVSSSATIFLQDYQQQGYLGSDTGLWIVPRITDIIVEELPALAQRQDGFEMRAKLKIVKGYLGLVSGSRQAQSSLAATRTILFQALIPLFDVEFASPSYETNAVVMGTLPKIGFRYMGPENVNIAKAVVRELGKALGIKYGTLAVDSCIADFYEAYLSRVEMTASTARLGTSHTEWLHEWIGCLVVAHETLSGAFDSPSCPEITKKTERRRHRALSTLASSVLPIITQSILWDLPLNEDFEANLPPPAIPSHGSLVQAIDKKNFRSPPKVSSAALYGNGIVIRILLELIARFSTLLQRKVEPFLSVILYPVVEKASQNAPLVHAAAASVLHHIAGACGYPDSSELLRRHFDHLVSSMIGRLRIPGGKLVPGDDKIDDILSVSSSLRFVLQSASCGDLERNSISSMVEIVTLLSERFNQLILRKAVRDENLFEFIVVCRASFSFLLVSYGANENYKYSYSMGSTVERAPQTTGPWREMLAPFRISMSDGLSPEEGFAQATNESTPQQDGEVLRESNSNSNDVSSNEIEFVSRLVARCCYFLSHSSLRMRIASCDALIFGFRFLAFVACYQTDTPTQEDSIRTSILRQIGTSWSPIEARLSTTSEGIIASQRVKSIVVFHPTSSGASSSRLEELAIQRTFLSKLIRMITAMVEGSGSFMADRIKNEVWPILSKQIELLISKRSLSRHNNKPMETSLLMEHSHDSRPASSGSSDWQNSEKILIIAILECLEHIFGQKECGPALCALVTSAGTVILPFLEDREESISIAAFGALQKMVEIDCDALWRPLLHLSGQGIPRHPLKRHASLQDFNARPVPHSHPLALKARELIAHIESLPEQVIW